MEKNPHLKRLIVLLASAMLLIVETGVFAYTWFASYVYSGALATPFFYKGNYAVIGMYALMMLIQQSSRPMDGALMGKYMELIDRLAVNVRFYRMRCNMKLEAAELAYKTMAKSEED